MNLKKEKKKHTVIPDEHPDTVSPMLFKDVAKSEKYVSAHSGIPHCITSVASGLVYCNSFRISSYGDQQSMGCVGKKELNMNPKE